MEMLLICVNLLFQCIAGLIASLYFRLPRLNMLVEIIHHARQQMVILLSQYP